MPRRESGEYCPDGATGFFFLKVKIGKGKDYLFEHMPPLVWNAFKDSTAPGIFYHREIEGTRYRFRLAGELSPDAPELACSR